MKAMLLRVGIDKGCGGALAPIFEDGSFEYIPIPEGDPDSTEFRTYNNTYGRSGHPLSYYLPKQIKDELMHFDPEFETFTYGDPTSKRKFLLKLNKNDLLVFYAGLTPYKNDEYPNALYIIGYFNVTDVINFNKISEEETGKYCNLYHNNAHIKRKMDFKDLVIVAGDYKRSKLLRKAIMISEPKLNKIGKPYHAVSKEMEKNLGIKGSIQRSIPPRTIKNQKNLENLKELLQSSNSYLQK
jgi:Nucleotide modification associated domain 3